MICRRESGTGLPERLRRFVVGEHLRGVVNLVVGHDPSSMRGDRVEPACGSGTKTAGVHRAGVASPEYPATPTVSHVSDGDGARAGAPGTARIPQRPKGFIVRRGPVRRRPTTCLFSRPLLRRRSPKSAPPARGVVDDTGGAGSSLSSPGPRWFRGEFRADLLAGNHNLG